jgi:trk system potassium uptake protein
LYEAVIGDATQKESLEPLLLNRAFGVFVSMGEDIARSILATLHARELGAKHIMVKGVTPEHGRVLKALGVARVVFPEVEIAQQVADQMTWPNVIDRLPIDSEHSFVEIAVPSTLVGKTLIEGDLRRKFGVFVVGVKDVFSGKLHMFPDPDFRLNDDQILLIVGKEDGVNKFRKNL